MNNLIVCPVGNPLTFDSRFDGHWRYTKQNRLYETLVFQYSDFVPEENSYDFLIKQKGFKWNLAKEWLSKTDYSKYEYIGFLDDDLITDIESINKSLLLAKERDLKIFQLSVTEDSDVFYSILRHRNDLVYAKTNFNEVMGPFIHTSLLPIIQEFWNQYDIFSGWGLDKVLCDITQTDAAVVHEYQMYHPKKHSSYDKTKAFKEMDLVTGILTQKFMKEKYNVDWKFTDSQKNKELVLKI